MLHTTSQTQLTANKLSKTIRCKKIVANTSTQTNCRKQLVAYNFVAYNCTDLTRRKQIVENKPSQTNRRTKL